MSKWYKASELERLNTPMPMDGVNGLPDNHVITVSERVIEIDESELVQNNVSTDTFTLELDAEWDDITPVVIFSNSKGDYKVAYENGPTKIPAAAMAAVGSVDVSVFGLDSTGEVRVVTKAAPNTMDVVESGKFVGQVSSDDVSLLGQILQAASDANTAAQTANDAAKNAGTTVDQLKENVETFLSQSQTSVDNAVSSAGTATSAANAAAQTAKTAADNADNSANAADAAATKANTSASRAENAYTTLQPILADISVSGNQPRKTLSGNIVSAKDAWLAKPLGLRVKGKTRQNLWVNPSGTMNGITVTANDDGSVTLSGANTSYVQISSPIIYTVKPNATYTLSIDKVVSSSSSSSISFVLFATNGVTNGQNIHVGYTGHLSQTFTTDSDVSNVGCRFYISTSQGTGFTVSDTYRIMLNEGDTAEPWCPPGLSSVDELSVVTAGKNLLNFDGAITMENGYGVRLPNTVLPPGTYFYQKFGEIAGEIVNLYHYDDVSAALVNGNGSFTTDTIINGLSVRTAKANVIDSDTLSGLIQLELGSTATDYEPPQVVTTPINLDGNILCSLTDGTCDELHIDGGGNVVLEKRTQTIQLDGDGTWNKYYDPFVHYISPWSQYGGSQSGYSADRSFVDKLLASSALPNGLYSANAKGSSAYLREPTFASDAADVKEWMGKNKPVVIIPLLEPQTIALPSVTLPTLPAPACNVYAYAEASGTGYAMAPDVEMEYIRDINITLADLEAKIADLVTKEAANV